MTQALLYCKKLVYHGSVLQTVEFAFCRRPIHGLLGFWVRMEVGELTGLPPGRTCCMTSRAHFSSLPWQLVSAVEGRGDSCLMAALLPPNWFLGVVGSDTPVHTWGTKHSKWARADSAPCSLLAHSRSPAALEHVTPSLCLLDLKKNKISQEVCWIPNLKPATQKKCNLSLSHFYFFF